MKSKEQMEKETALAKDVDILAVARYFGADIKRQGATYKDRNDEGLVFFPNTNSFFHFYYDGIGGSSIDYVMYRNDVGLQEAIEILIGISGKNVSEFETNYVSKSSNKDKNTDKEFVLPEASNTYKRVFAYLHQIRCISAEVITQMMHEKKLYESKDKHNAVFVAYDKSGNAKHAFLRSTISNKVWRGDTAGSDKAYGFSVSGQNNTLIVFEAPIDLLSYMTLHSENKSHLLALGMLSIEPIVKYIEEYPNITNISFALDVDEPGIDATRRFASILKQQGYDCSRNKILLDVIQTGCKDINEYNKYLYLKRTTNKEEKRNARKNDR